jgi:hypothetical protein
MNPASDSGDSPSRAANTSDEAIDAPNGGEFVIRFYSYSELQGEVEGGTRLAGITECDWLAPRRRSAKRGQTDSLLALSSFVITINLSGKCTVEGGNSPSEVSGATYRTSSDVAKEKIAAILRKIADAIDARATSLLLRVIDKTIVE